MRVPLNFSDGPVAIDVHNVEFLLGEFRELYLLQDRLVYLHTGLDFLPADPGHLVRVADRQGFPDHLEMFGLQGAGAGSGGVQQAGDTEEEESKLEHDLTGRL